MTSTMMPWSKILPLCTFWMLSGCAAKMQPNEAVSSPTPILPAYKATVYTLAPTPPRDPLVLEQVRDFGLVYDEALSGAATALALREGQGLGIESGDVTWACLRSGWPYPLQAYRTAVLEKDENPKGLLADLDLRPESKTGLVRARTSDADVWVFLLSNVPETAEPLAMQYTLGETLPLPMAAYQNVSHFAVKPTGEQVDLRDPPTLDEAGEWLLEAKRDGSTLFRAAVYVDMDIPESPPIPYVPPEESDELRLAQAHQMLSQMHSDFFGDDVVLTREAALDRSAAVALDAILENRKIPSVEVRLERLGFVRSPRHQIGCNGSSPRDCLNTLFWSTQGRSNLLSPDHKSVGLASSTGPKGEWTLMVNLAGD
jgi:hypothetical protein